MVELMQKYKDGVFTTLAATKAEWNRLKATHGARVCTRDTSAASSSKAAAPKPAAAKSKAKGKSKSKPKAKAKSKAADDGSSRPSSDSD